MAFFPDKIDPDVQRQRDIKARSIVASEASDEPDNPYLQNELADRDKKLGGAPSGRFVPDPQQSKPKASAQSSPIKPPAQPLGSRIMSGIKDYEAGGIEAPLNMATGMIAKPISDVAGLAAMGKEMASPSAGGGDISGFKDYVQNALTYQPRTHTGQAMSQYNPISLIGRGIDYVGEKSGGLIKGDESNPIRVAAGNAMHEGINQLPSLAGVKIGKGMADSLPAKQAALDIQKGENLPRDTIRDQSQAAGLTTPPEGTSWLSGIPGISKVNKLVSAADQPKINRLIADEVGIPKGVAITETELENVRSKNSNAYRALTEIGNDIKHNVSVPSKLMGADGKPLMTATTKAGFKTDEQFNQSINKMVHDVNELQSELPATFKASDASLNLLGDYMNKDIFTPATTIKAIRQLRKDAATEFKSDDPAKMASAFTRKEIANQLEDLIERNLETSGQTKALADYKKARQIYAKSYDIQSALDNTGNINARKLYAISQKRPLTGNLKLVADFAGAYPEAVQRVPSGSTAITPWDWLVGAGGVAAGHPEALGMVGARVGVPMIAKSGALQKKTPSYKAKDRSALPPALGIPISSETQRKQLDNPP